MKSFCRSLLLSFALFPCLFGCAGETHTSIKRVSVSGKVTIDSKPVTSGRIVFDPGPSDIPSSLPILDGNYEGSAPIGKNTVRISAMRKISKDKMKVREGPGYDQMVEENMLPPRYNTESKIQKEVLEKGENKFNFDLLSK